jgi:hypothetical protein
MMQPDVCYSPVPVLALMRERWHPGIGDPTVMGWLTVAAYFCAAALCARLAFVAGTRGPAELRRNSRIFWTVFAVLMVFLGVNKQLDLQTWLTQFGKDLAKAGGWYEQRRSVQAVFVAFVAVSGLAAFAGLSLLAKRTFRQSWVALAGALFLGCFILVRAASFHHVDQLLSARWAGLKMNWILELGGIFWISLGAWQNLRTPTSLEQGN